MVWLQVLTLSVAAQDLQPQLRGQVTDAETGEPLPSASVQILPQTPVEFPVGTTTDAEGRFSITLPRLPATVLVRFVGYRTLRFTVRAGEPLTRTIPLHPETFLLDELVVTDENPGVHIMREVIRRKQLWRRGLERLQAAVYSRFWLQHRNEIVRITETISDAYWTSEAGPFEVALAQYRRPEGANFRFASTTHMPNFYDDEIELDGFRYTGPTHPDALDLYDFRIGGQTEADGQILIDIAVRPRSASTTGFIGRIQVIDSVYALHEVELRPAQTLQKPAPVQYWSVTYQQTFRPVRDSIYVPEEYRVRGRVEVGIPGVQYPSVAFSQLSVMNMYQPNGPMADSVFTRPHRFDESEIIFAGEALFERFRYVAPLTPREVEALETMDLRRSVNQLFRPQGLLRNYLSINLEAASVRTALPPLVQSTNLLTSWRAWHNRVDDTYLALRPRFALGRQMGVGFELGRHIRIFRPAPFDPDLNETFEEEIKRRRAWLGTTTGFWTLVQPFKTQPFTLELDYRDGIEPTYTSLVNSRLLNTAAYLFGYPDYFDYARNQRTHLTARYAWPTTDWTFGLTYKTERYRAIATQLEVAGLFTNRAPRTNPAVDEGALQAIVLNVAKGTKNGLFVWPETSYATLQAEMGTLDDLGKYGTLRGTIGFRWQTLFRDRPRPQTLSVLTYGQYSWGNVPRQRLGILEASLGPFNPFGGFKTWRDVPYQGAQTVGVFWDYDLGDALHAWNLRLPFGLAFHGGHGRTWNTTARNLMLGNRVTHGFHHEVGLSLIHPFRYPIRVNVTRRLDGGGWFISLGLMKP